MCVNTYTRHCYKYLYHIEFRTGGKTDKPYYFRIDRIKQITIRRKYFNAFDALDFDEELLRKRSFSCGPVSSAHSF